MLCVVRGKSGITLWRLGSRDPGGSSSLGALPRDLDIWDIGPDGRVAAAARDGSVLAIVDASTRSGTRVALGGVQLQGTQPTPTSFTTDVAVAADVVATLVVRDRKSEVTLYRMR